MSKGFTGISFPFRLNNKGGLKMSTTSFADSSHIKESIIQILNTQIGERIMELNFGTSLSSSIFSPNDNSAHSLIDYEIRQVMKKLEPRIEVGNINLYSSDNENGITLELEYRVIQYNSTQQIKIEIGG